MEGSYRGDEMLQEVINVVWGTQIKPEIFARWSQGFVFSSEERTALIQMNGGPCAVIAPVQAFLLKNLIPNCDLEGFRELDCETIDKYLALALTEVLSQCRQGICSSHTTGGEKGEGSSSEGPHHLACLDDPVPNCPDNVNSESDSSTHHPDIPSPPPSDKDHSLFHNSIRLRQFDSKHNLQNYIECNIGKFKVQYGVLLFLYSLILTKGVKRVMEEMGDLSESLIDSSEGHGSQALINLLITGRASSFVWDGSKDVGGLSLIGIERRPTVGFLTRLEHLRYVQVGWYLKNPTSPVWVLGSETHLTVLFSWLAQLVTPDTEVERAKQVFSWYDVEGNNFIKREQLGEIMDKLGLCTDEDFIKFMCTELDPDNMGVILYHKFLETFFNVADSYTPPDTFTIFHYNGLESSCPQNKIHYAEGCVTVQESHVRFTPSNSEFLTCITSKWPNLDVHWKNFTPSLN
ncbi:ubiquitin carboxyl-terminal hydrolase MINDY-3 [Oratosquilla oratoria]|uniref:ubiquitin carboxyl-terminal hydrolase MINDY-3 n=1 Tax=Oratosquilla oratoria TaxID=337810 RepID=UPI003F757543